jgi:hypothetical protein
MARTTRSENLDLIRHLNGTHERAAKKLAGLTNASYISQMATGIKEITDYDARQIEKALELPDGWMDREHLAMLGMSKLDYDIYTNVSRRPEEAKAGLLTFLAASGHQG